MNSALSRSTVSHRGLASRTHARGSSHYVRAAVPSHARSINRRTIAMAGSSGGGEEKSKDGSESDPLASDFMKELQRRGINEAADADKNVAKEAAKEAEELLRRASGKQADSAFGRKPSSPQWANSANQGEDQLARSRRLNSEGLEGLIPRGTELIKLGVGSVLAFWPFIAGIAIVFTLTFKLFGSDFLHDGEIYRYKATPYMVPEGLLAEPTVDKFVAF